MAQVIVRNLDNQVIRNLKSRAAGKGISLEQQLRDVITRSAQPSRSDLLDAMDRSRALTPLGRRGAHRKSTAELIREDRDNNDRHR